MPSGPLQRDSYVAWLKLGSATPTAVTTTQIASEYHAKGHRRRSAQPTNAANGRLIAANQNGSSRWWVGQYASAMIDAHQIGISQMSASARRERGGDPPA